MQCDCRNSRYAAFCTNVLHSNGHAGDAPLLNSRRVAMLWCARLSGRRRSRFGPERFAPGSPYDLSPEIFLSRPLARPLLSSNSIFAAQRRGPGRPSGGPVMRAPAGVRRPSYPCCSMEDVAVRDLDLAPLWRSTVGFDRFFDLVEDSARWTGEDNYPPYNIEKVGDDQYAISL